MKELIHSTIGVVVNQIKPVTVIYGGKVSLCHGQTNTVCETLSEGASGDFDAYMRAMDQPRMYSQSYERLSVSVACFRVTWSLRINLTEGLEIIHGKLIAQ